MSLFEPFADWEDLTACVPASSTAAALNAQGEAHKAHWPLWLDPDQPLGELFLSTRVTSRSFRYGSVGSNVLGLRWRLPSGKIVDLGGRVVKNVAGFDLVRFLSGTQGRFGQPENLVLRLRPLAPAQAIASLKGSWSGLARLVSLVRASSWAHAIEAADWNGGEVHLLYSNEASLLPLFEKAVRGWAELTGLACRFGGEWPRHEAAPWARAQAPLSQLLAIAERWSAPVSGFLGQGLLHLSPGTEMDLAALHAELAPQGGHVEHPSLPPAAGAPQARWEAELLQRLGALA